jgi:hypothetical protein
MKTLEQLKDDYQNLDKEAGKYNRPEFDEVFNIIAELIKDDINVGDKGNLTVPLITGSVIDEALRKSGYHNDKKFVSDFKKYREIEQHSREVQLKIISHPDNPIRKLLNEEKVKKSGNWRFIPIRIIAPDFMMPTIEENLEKDLRAGKGLYEVKTNVPLEDEDDDFFLAIEAYGIKCSLEPYYRELQEYKVIDKYFSDKETKKNFLSIIFDITKFIKENTSSPNKIRNKITNTIKALDKIVGVGLIWQILILQGIIMWIENIEVNEGDNGYEELRLLHKWITEFLIGKILEFTYYNWGEQDLITLEPLCNYLYSIELGKAAQTYLFSNSQNNKQITHQDSKISDFNRTSKNINNMNNRLIENIKTRTISNRWENGKAGQFNDFDNNYVLRFSETDEDLFHFLLKEEERRNTPIIAVGFIAWLIAHWEEDTDKIFKTYLDLRLKQYKAQHINSPDAFKRDLEKEFYAQYQEKEEKWIKHSEAIFEYVSENEAHLLKEFAKNYLEFISQFNQKPYKKYKTFDEAISDCAEEDRVLLHTFRQFCTPPHIEPVEMLNDILMIRAKSNEEPQKCLDFIMDKYSNAWKEYYVILFTLKNTLDKNNNFQLFIPEKIENTHPLIGYTTCLENTRKRLSFIPNDKKIDKNRNSDVSITFFRDLLLCDNNKKDSVINFVRNALHTQSKKNVTLAIITKALEKKKYLLVVQNRSHYHRIICDEFGTVGTESGFNSHYGDRDFEKFKEKEIQACIDNLP